MSAESGTPSVPEPMVWQMFVAPKLRDGYWFECEAPDEATAWQIGREWHPGAKVERPLSLLVEKR